ncbi:hypothetical protein GGR57DRAFT_403703 [Xylariaceae sp. FL1272]|nr:hypothetical protein GGR57DRAFT_403703 [Xylariaceae sp. FL1272]
MAPSFRILELPDEILALVFEAVRSSTAQNLGFSHEIANTRQVCRKFCATSSHLLTNHVAVTFQSKSIERFQWISHHPILSKSILNVRVDLAYYHSELAANLPTFAGLLSKELDKATHDWVSGRHKDHHACLSAVEIGDIHNEYFSAAQTWQNIADGVETKSCTATEALQVCHREYQRRYKDQRWILGSGSFVKTICNAIARMPCFQSLVIVDSYNPNSPPFNEISGNLVEFGMKWMALLAPNAHYRETWCQCHQDLH